MGSSVELQRNDYTEVEPGNFERKAPKEMSPDWTSCF
jgi:hypothetical protein